MTNLTNEQIMQLLSDVKTKFDDANETEDTQTSEAEKKFVKKVDTAYQVATTSLSLVTTICSFYCPPISIAVASMLVVISAIHYYDKKNNYCLSHWASDKYKGVFATKKKYGTENNEANILSSTKKIQDTLAPSIKNKTKTNIGIAKQVEIKSSSIFENFVNKIAFFTLSMFAKKFSQNRFAKVCVSKNNLRLK